MGEERERERELSKRGIPIGNVTSQMFANIYLNELDRFVKHRLRVRSYLRYGDDFVLFGKNQDEMNGCRSEVRAFLSKELHLKLHARNDVIYPCERGLTFLGCHIFPAHRHLKRQAWSRALQRADLRNISSYSGLVRSHSAQATKKHFAWHVLGLLEKNHL